MKTRHLIPIFGLFLIGFADTVLAQETNKPSSADSVTAKIAGVWKRDSQHSDTSFDFVYTYRANGDHAEKSTRIFQGKATITYRSGKWEVKDGLLIETIIKTDTGTPGILNPLHHALVTAHKIVRLSDNEMVLHSDAVGDEVWKRQD